jgi:hypothetical protein
LGAKNIIPCPPKGIPFPSALVYSDVHFLRNAFTRYSLACVDFFLVFLRPKNHFLAGLARVSKTKKESEGEGEDDLQVFTFCLPSGSAAPD